MTDIDMPDPVSTTVEADVYNTLFEAYEQQNYREILGDTLTELFADDPAELQEIAGEVLTRYHGEIN